MYFALLVARAFGLIRSLGFVFLLGLAYPPAMLLVLPADSPWWSVVNSSAIVLWIQWCLGMVAVEAYYGIVELPRWCSTLWLAPIWAGLAVCSADRDPALSPPSLGDDLLHAPQRMCRTRAGEPLAQRKGGPLAVPGGRVLLLTLPGPQPGSHHTSASWARSPRRAILYFSSSMRA